MNNIIYMCTYVYMFIIGIGGHSAGIPGFLPAEVYGAAFGEHYNF